jgi:hypothetical protein
MEILNKKNMNLTIFERYKSYLLGDIERILLKNQYKEITFLCTISHYYSYSGDRSISWIL